MGRRALKTPDASPTRTPSSASLPPPSLSSLPRSLLRRLAPGSINYKEVAAAAAVSRPHVSRVLQGKGEASFEVMKRISAATGVSLDDLRLYIEAVKADNARRKDEAA